MGTIENMMEMSKELLEKSMETGHTDEEIEAMREFSQFLQNMADKALVAMDKIGAMGGMAQEVAFKMLDLIVLTERNLLQAQQNFNNLILGLSGANSSN
jgi:DNA-directed RNA polymerase subunit F